MMNKNLLVIGLGRASQMLMMFLTYRVLSTIFSVEDMGAYYFLISISGMFSLLLANPLGVYAIRKLNDWKINGNMNRNLFILICTFTLTSLLLFPILYFLREKIVGSQIDFMGVALILLFYVLASTIHGTLIPLLNFLGKATHFVVWTFITTLLGLIFSIGIVHYYSNDPLLWLLGQAIAFGLIAIVVFILMMKKFPDTDEVSKIVNFSSLKRVLSFAVPIAMTNIFIWIMAQSFRFFLKNNVNSTDLGEMVFGLGLASALSVAVEYLIQQIYLPGYYKNLTQADLQARSHEWNLLFNRIIHPYIYLVFYLCCLSPFILTVLADAKFKNSYYFLAIGALVEFFRIVSNMLNMTNQSEMKTHRAIIPYLAGGSITLVGVLLISYFGEYVKLTPIVLIIGYLVINLLLLNGANKLFKIEIKKKGIFKSIIFSFVFGIGLFFWKFSNSLVASVTICLIFGLYLLFLFYRSYQDSVCK